MPGTLRAVFTPHLKTIFEQRARSHTHVIMYSAAGPYTYPARRRALPCSYGSEYGPATGFHTTHSHSAQMPGLRRLSYCWMSVLCLKLAICRGLLTSRRTQIPVFSAPNKINCQSKICSLCCSFFLSRLFCWQSKEVCPAQVYAPGAAWQYRSRVLKQQLCSQIQLDTVRKRALLSFFPSGKPRYADLKNACGPMAFFSQSPIKQQCSENPLTVWASNNKQARRHL